MRRSLAASVGTLVIAGFTGAPANAAGQSEEIATVMSEPVTVALVDQLPSLGGRAPDAYDAVIIRRVDAGDVILLPKNKADGELLDAATRTLLRFRAQQAMRSDRRGQYRSQAVADIKIGVRNTKATKQWADQHIAKAQKVIDRLNAASTTRQIPGIGTMKAVRFNPPRPRPPSEQPPSEQQD